MPSQYSLLEAALKAIDTAFPAIASRPQSYEGLADSIAAAADYKARYGQEDDR